MGSYAKTKIALSFEIGEMDFCGGFLRFKTYQVTFEIPSC